MKPIPQNSWLKAARLVWQSAGFGSQNPLQEGEKQGSAEGEQEQITPGTLTEKNKVAKDRITEIFKNSSKRGEKYIAVAPAQVEEAKKSAPPVDKQTNESLGIDVGNGKASESQS